MLLLFFLDKSKSKLKERVEADTTAEAPSDPEVLQAVKSEISKIPLSSTQSRQVAQVMTRLVDKEVHKKATFLSKEIGKQYANMLDDRDKKIKAVEEKIQVTTQQLESVSKNYKKVKQEKKQTEAVVRSIADGLIVVNEKGETLLMNPAAEKLLGIKKEDAIGRSLQSQAKEEQLISLAGGAGEEREIQVNSSNEQTKKVLRASTAVIENEFGQTMGMVSVLTDVTKQKELEELKSKFVSNVSHELRTPLAAIKESVNLFLDKMLGPVSSEQEQVLIIAKRNIARLARLIDNVLDLSKLEAGKLELKISSFKLDEYVNQNVKSFDAWANSKGIKLKIELPPEPVELEADQDRMSQVLTNLVGNAFKFTPNGGEIAVEAKLVPLSQSDSTPSIEIGVKDTGPGIPPKEQEKIFEKFGQGSARPVDKISGTGLGLTISKEIVELHHGRIGVESDEGKGARFFYVIPLKQPQKEKPSTEQVQS